MQPNSPRPPEQRPHADTSVADAKWLLGTVAAAWLLPLVVGFLAY